MRKPVCVNTLLLTDEELSKMKFKNKDNLYCSIRPGDGINEVRIYVTVDID